MSTFCLCTYIFGKKYKHWLYIELLDRSTPCSVCARGRRCWMRWRWRCTKIWRNYTTRPLASLIPHHPRALTLFQPLSHFSQPSHSSFCPLFFREENTSDKTKYEFTKSYLEYIQDRTFYKLDQFGVGRYGHQCRQGDKDALTKASKCRNLERSD